MKDKKLSAFAILKGKKTKTETASSQPGESTDATVSLKKANSTPAINEDESTSKRFLRAFKGGSFRSTLRGNKHRPTILSDGTGNSPFVAGNEDGVKLTGVKEKEKSAKDASLGLGKKSQSNGAVHSKTVDNKPLLATTPRLPHPPSKHPQESPRLSGARAAAKQKKPLPPVPKVDFSETPKTSSPNLHGSKSVSTPDISGIHQSETSADKLVKKKGKRGLDDGSPDSARKKQKVSSPKPTRIVPPQLLSQPEARKKVSAMHLLDSVTDSQEDARKLFECMIHPVTVDKFFSELWEKKPLLVRRHIRNYNKGWFSTEELDRILHNEFVQFGVNLDVTSYRDGKRETHNPPGRAYRSLVWDFYQNGCSIRLLNPQTYSESVWKMLTTLQEYFGCCVGANVYLTPAGTQGFAPHYDDIEAFILQLEGKKHWRLYNPRSKEETLPRFSSGNFTDADIGPPVLDVTLEAGDLLYFPRGIIHQANSLEDAHSLHITVSCYQRNTWGDLLHKLVPRALDIAIEEDVMFRQGLPVDYLNYMGLANSDVDSQQRTVFLERTMALMRRLMEQYLPTDAACDQLGKQFMHDSLPPFLTEGEKSCSIHGHGERWDPAGNAVRDHTEMEPDTMVKLIRKGCLRLITEDDVVRVYHNIENARVYHGREPQYIEISAELAPAVELLLHSYPEYVAVDSLPAETVEERLEIATILYDKGLLVTGEPLQNVHVDDTSSDEGEEEGDS